MIENTEDGKMKGGFIHEDAMLDKTRKPSIQTASHMRIATITLKLSETTVEVGLLCNELIV